MKYKGYIGIVTYDDEAKTFHGDVIGLRDAITFKGKSVDELEQAFKDSVEDYLAFCRELDREPEKTFSGNIRLRLEPDLHADLMRKATMHGLSLNSFIAEQLKRCR